jgi:hypothetical protein
MFTFGSSSRRDYVTDEFAARVGPAPEGWVRRWEGWSKIHGHGLLWVYPDQIRGTLADACLAAEKRATKATREQ